MPLPPVTRFKGTGPGALGYALRLGTAPGLTGAALDGRLTFTRCAGPSESGVLGPAEACSTAAGAADTRVSDGAAADEPRLDPLRGRPPNRAGVSDSCLAGGLLEEAADLEEDGPTGVNEGVVTLAPCRLASVTEDVADTSIGLTGAAAPNTSGAFQGRLSLTA